MIIRVDYINSTLNDETYTMAGDAAMMTLEKCWDRMEWVCQRNGWNVADAAQGNIRIKFL